MADFKTLAEQIVSTWPKLTVSQNALISSVIEGGTK